MRIHNEPIISSGNMASSINSSAVPVPHIYGFSIHLVWTGSPVGVLTLQASDDSLSLSAPTNWTDIAGATQSISAAGSHIFEYIGFQSGWVRCVYTRTSGTGTLNARINMKGA